MKKIMLLITGLFLGLIWCYGALLAQERVSETKYAVEVSVSRLNIRNGPGTNFRIICTISKGTKLVVVGEKTGWLKVQLPSEAPCWVYKPLIDRKEGDQGVIKKGRVNIRASRNSKSSGNIIGQLSKEQEVVIIGEKDNWYKIAPPEILRAWVSQKYTRYWGTDKEYQKWVEGEREKTVQEAELKEKFEKAEEIYTAESLSPYLKQDFAEALRLYQEIIDKSENKELVTKAQERVKFIKPRQELLMEYREAINQKDAKIEEIRNEFVRRMKEIGKEPAEESRYIAQGWVDSMGKFFKRPGTHRLIKGGKTLYFLKSTAVNLDDYYKRFVGIKGQVRESLGWPQETIMVEEIDIIGKE